MKYYIIYEYKIGDVKDNNHIVCIRDTRENAQIVLEALKKTNTDFSTYKIEIHNDYKK